MLSAFSSVISGLTFQIASSMKLTAQRKQQIQADANVKATGVSNQLDPAHFSKHTHYTCQNIPPPPATRYIHT